MVEVDEVEVFAGTLEVEPVVDPGRLDALVALLVVLPDGCVTCVPATVAAGDVWYWSATTSPAAASAVRASRSRTRFSLEDRIATT